MGIGIWQLLLILVIIFVIFGAGKLPNVLKDVGKGVKNLKDGLNSDEGNNADATSSMKDITPEESSSSKASQDKKES